MRCLRVKWLSTDALWPRERPITWEGVIPEMLVSAQTIITVTSISRMGEIRILFL
jgi:hypothetical protein